MEQDREKWTGKIKKKLSEHSEPVSKNSWESLLNEVSPDKNISQKKGRFGQYIKYVAAACLAVLLGTGITVYYLSRETSTIVNASAVTTTIQVKNNSATAVKNQAATQLTARVKKGSIGTIVHSSEEKNHTAKTVTASDKTDSFPSNNTANNNLLAASNNTGNIVPASGKSNIAEKSATKEIFTEKELFGDSVEELDKAKSKKGTRKSHFNNSGTLIAMYTGIGAGQIKSFTAQKDMLESPNSTAFMGSLNNIKLENNLFNPAFLKNEDLNYKMPVSYGIAVRKYMINNISIDQASILQNSARNLPIITNRNKTYGISGYHLKLATLYTIQRDLISMPLQVVLWRFAFQQNIKETTLRAASKRFLCNSQ